MARSSLYPAPAASDVKSDDVLPSRIDTPKSADASDGRKATSRVQLDMFLSEAAPVSIGDTAVKKQTAQCVRCIECFLSDREVAKRYDISRASVWRWLASEPTFPAPVKLSAGTSRWKLSDLIQFEAKARKAERKKRSATTLGAD
jgi:predicted DNA-binding transcriptional regulator AlpA